ncbi:TetR/AcrR family transcriptional regulator [Azospirillum doebereinerae]
MTTNMPRPRGRPRRFDPEQAVATAQRLFHARGYDAVTVADLTEALGINPPSFYAAFGSKAVLYARTLSRYTGTEGIPLADILRPGCSVAEALSAVLEESARRYCANPAAAGCLVIEGARCNDPDARNAARALTAAAEDTIRSFIAATHPEVAGRLTDYVVTMMIGLSTMAREGHALDRLLATARLASPGIAQALRA